MTSSVTTTQKEQPSDNTTTKNHHDDSYRHATQHRTKTDKQKRRKQDDPEKDMYDQKQGEAKQKNRKHLEHFPWTQNTRLLSKPDAKTTFTAHMQDTAGNNNYDRQNLADFWGIRAWRLKEAMTSWLGVYCVDVVEAAVCVC